MKKAYIELVLPLEAAIACTAEGQGPGRLDADATLIASNDATLSASSDASRVATTVAGEGGAGEEGAAPLSAMSGGGGGAEVARLIAPRVANALTASGGGQEGAVTNDSLGHHRGGEVAGAAPEDEVRSGNGHYSVARRLSVTGEADENGKGGGLERLDRDQWREQWAKFMDARGEDSKWPFIAGRQVDLYNLYYTVEEHGGSEEVSRKRHWREVARCMQYLPGASGTVKHHYVRQLLSFCIHLNISEEDEARQDKEDMFKEDMFVDDPLEMPNNLLLQDCKDLSQTLSTHAAEVEGSIKGAEGLFKSLRLPNPPNISISCNSALSFNQPPPQGVMQRRDDSAREGRGPMGEDSDMGRLDAMLQELNTRATHLDGVHTKLNERVKRILHAPLKSPLPLGEGGGVSGKRSARQMVPLYRQVCVCLVCMAIVCLVCVSCVCVVRVCALMVVVVGGLLCAKCIYVLYVSILTCFVFACYVLTVRDLRLYSCVCSRYVRLCSCVNSNDISLCCR